MKPKLYLETTIVSYLTARPSRDIITAGHQQMTQEWWDSRRLDFELFISQPVLQEAGAGDQEAAQRRFKVLEPIPVLELTEEVAALAGALVEEGPLPEKAATDALHIALATVHGMDYLLTWNCKHIANAEMRHAVTAVCHLRGYEPPVICTPEELLGE